MVSTLGYTNLRLRLSHCQRPAMTMFIGEMNFLVEVLPPSFIFRGVEYGGDQPIHKKVDCNSTPFQAQDHILLLTKQGIARKASMDAF